MAIPTFFYHGDVSAQQTLILSDSESMHATKSRRLKVADSVQIINGQGILAQGVLASIDKRQTSVDIISTIAVTKPVKQLIIATAIPKGDRQKVMLDMLTQLGVSAIVPLVCDRSVTTFKPTMRDKWQRIFIEACKQSQRAWLPSLFDAMSPAECVASFSKPDTLIWYADANTASAKEPSCDITTQLIMVGPEGGFSQTEQTLFDAQCCQALPLARSILRTETASVAAAARFALC